MKRRAVPIIPHDRIAFHLEAARTASGPGRNSTWFEDLVDAYACSEPVPRELSAEVYVDLCRSATLKCVAAGAITAKTLQAHVSREVKGYTSRPKRPYIVITSVSLAYDPVLRPITIRGCQIRFAATLPKRFRRDHIRDARIAPTSREANGFANVRVRVMARSVYEAFEQASAALDFLRATWNFSLNRGIWRHFSDPPRPMNQILGGPVTTVHHPDGSPASDAYWFEPCFRPPPRLKRPQEYRWDRVVQESARIQQVVERARLGDGVFDVFVRYSRALDDSNPAHSFVQLWSLLETLTDTSQVSHRTAIERVAFLYAEPELYRLVLDALRVRRNRRVHAGHEPPGADHAVVRLHRYVAHLLEVALSYTHCCHTWQEFGSFLALPRNPETLKRQIAMRRRAIRFHTPSP